MYRRYLIYQSVRGSFISYPKGNFAIVDEREAGLYIKVSTLGGTSPIRFVLRKPVYAKVGDTAE